MKDRTFYYQLFLSVFSLFYDQPIMASIFYVGAMLTNSINNLRLRSE